MGREGRREKRGEGQEKRTVRGKRKKIQGILVHKTIPCPVH